MDLVKVANIDEQLDSTEVKELCFLCLDVITRKRLETVKNGKDLFLRLEEKGLDTPGFLSMLMRTIGRADLDSVVVSDSSIPEETDLHPVLSDYRVMLYEIYHDMTKENLDKMKFLLTNQLGRRQLEACSTVLDVFSEMEKRGHLSNTVLDELHTILLECDQQLALKVQRYREGGIQQPPATSASPFSIDHQRDNRTQPAYSQLPLPTTESISFVDDAQSDTEPSFVHDQREYYALTQNPRGLCVIINNETFVKMNERRGSHEDAKALADVFSQLGFKTKTHKNLTAKAMRQELLELGKRNFSNDDALVVCVLSHGELSCVFGTDEEKVLLQDLTQPFTSEKAPTLAKKPKLFFIQACQGTNYQKGAFVMCSPKLGEGEGNRERLEEDAGPNRNELVAVDSDFLVGMSTVPNCKSFRHTTEGSIYIQELCKQLLLSARRNGMDDIHSVLTRVNNAVSSGEYNGYKQMPEPKYTLTKKLVLTFVKAN